MSVLDLIQWSPARNSRRLFVALGAALLAPFVPANGAIFTPAEQARVVALIQSNPAAKSAFARLRQQADRALRLEPNPIPRIQTEGKLAGDPLKVATAAALKDMSALYGLGYAYAVTGDADYA